MHIAAVLQIHNKLIPAMDELIHTFERLESENYDAIKSGRTHLQDATPIRFSQEISGWRGMLENTKEMIKNTLPALEEIALGGTAVGTGLNAPKTFGEEAAKAVSEFTGMPFKTAPNKFQALTSKDAIVFAHGALKALAADMMKIANDVRWLSSGRAADLARLRFRRMNREARSCQAKSIRLSVSL